MPERITLTTDDGVEVAGTWVDAGAPAPAVLLLHMMPATKESYAVLQTKLRAAGVSSLAIDFRGHGESRTTTSGSTLDFTKFSDAEHQAYIKDAEAARGWLVARGFDSSRLAVVGASIGANIALELMAAHPDMPAGVLLSPGLNYRGVVTMPFIQAVTREQSVYLVASAEDAESAKAVEKLAEVSLARTEVKLFDTAGHGTAMFEREPVLINVVADWLRSRLERPRLRD